MMEKVKNFVRSYIDTLVYYALQNSGFVIPFEVMWEQDISPYIVKDTFENEKLKPYVKEAFVDDDGVVVIARNPIC